jgi:hypothetical protein
LFWALPAAAFLVGLLDGFSLVLEGLEVSEVVAVVVEEVSLLPPLATTPALRTVMTIKANQENCILGGGLTRLWMTWKEGNKSVDGELVSVEEEEELNLRNGSLSKGWREGRRYLCVQIEKVLGSGSSSFTPPFPVSDTQLWPSLLRLLAVSLHLTLSVAGSLSIMATNVVRQ